MMFDAITELNKWLNDHGLRDYSVLDALNKLYRERDLAQKNFEYYFQKYMKATGKTIAESEEEYHRCMRGTGKWELRQR